MHGALKKRPQPEPAWGRFEPASGNGGDICFFHDHFRQQMATPVSSIEQIT
ncbi:hypothetical protein B4098_1683 [Heyndrickxia coagulans]|uniref:Uncharacterized protein n=1 Tax=Heyndrickxia coagulans TaxID=1398 RepID=A0A150K7U1_HEYCO|nr:hypothetical protein B4098_1683 [Heyndrickxia coagulans]